MTSGHPRVGCCVPGCTRGTTRIEAANGWTWLDTGTTDPGWICGVHWPRVPRSLKRRRTSLVRAWRRKLKQARVSAFWELPAGAQQRIAIVRTERLIRAVWARCVRHASGMVEVPAGELPDSVREDLARLGL